MFLHVNAPMPSGLGHLLSKRLSDAHTRAQTATAGAAHDSDPVSKSQRRNKAEEG